MSILNLARKFRVTRFEEIVGQSLAVRMLKNGLYIDRLFPVYLFFGQHGCGKTSMARIFATTVNCESISLFRTSPKSCTIPCMSCLSCCLMQEGKHPDFIEIDAASYTGVDNIRNIIESASFLPVSGRKKIYLIDEAHMLSKAAFNALLKILEEPPATVLFMLATTDAEKIIETVRSRCFQLILQPVLPGPIVDYLISICQKEEITYDAEGLWIVAGQAKGSVRDALNIVERVRCAYPSITVDAVYAVLGNVSDHVIGELLQAIYVGDVQKVTMLLAAQELMSIPPENIWRQIVQLLRVVWYAKQHVSIHNGVNRSAVATLGAACSTEFIGFVIQHLYRHEPLFLKTQTPRFFIEHLLVVITERQQNREKIDNKSEQVVVKKNIILVEDKSDNEEKKTNSHHFLEAAVTIVDTKGADNAESTPVPYHVPLFLERIQGLVGPMIYSAFNQAVFTFDHQADRLQVNILFPLNLAILEDALTESTRHWLATFKDVFGQQATYVYKFEYTKEEKKTGYNSIEKKIVHNQLQENNKHEPVVDNSILPSPVAQRAVSSQKKSSKTVDITDSAMWPQVHMILTHFPGSVTFIDR